MSKHQPPKPPEACIRKVNERTYCGRDIDRSDFVFTDADYALAHYKSNATMQACPTCIAQVETLNKPG
jgi:hypothetical protein